MTNENNFKSGFISIVGRPNVGKSTLVNQIVNKKIAIVSDKAQTTRNTISGIRTTEDSQMVFVDTPGIHKPKHRLGDFMNKSALTTLNEVDVVLFVVNATEKRGPGDNFIMERLASVNSPVFLLINKIDQIDPEEIFAIIESYRKDFDFAEIVPISAIDDVNIDKLMSLVKDRLEEGPLFFPDDQITDHPESFIVKETIREKVLQLTREEIPHSIAVVLESIERNEDDKIEISASIIVERSSQKGIVIGKNGQMLKRIGTLARKDLEALLEDKIYLNLWVRVKEDWRDKEQLLNKFGYSTEDYL